MALRRSFLKGLGLNDEQIEAVIEAHSETIDGLRADVNKYKGDAEKLPGVQRELDELKAAGDGGYKKRYEDEHAAFETYKGQQAAKEARVAKEKAVRAYYETKGIKGANLEIAMKGSSSEIDGLELDGENIKDAKALDTLIDGTFAGLVSSAPTFNWSAPVGGDNPNNTSSAMNALIRGAIK